LPAQPRRVSRASFFKGRTASHKVDLISQALCLFEIFSIRRCLHTAFQLCDVGCHTASEQAMAAAVPHEPADSLEWHALSRKLKLAARWNPKDYRGLDA